MPDRCKEEKRLFYKRGIQLADSKRGWKLAVGKNVIGTEFTEAAYYHIYILFIGSFSRLFSRLTPFVKDLGWLHTHVHILNQSLSGCICCRTGANIPDGDGPRIREDFPSFNKQSNDTVLRINLLKEAQDQCGLSRVQRFIQLRREKYLRCHSELFPRSLKEATNVRDLVPVVHYTMYIHQHAKPGCVFVVLLRERRRHNCGLAPNASCFSMVLRNTCTLMSDRWTVQRQKTIAGGR